MVAIIANLLVDGETIVDHNWGGIIG